MLRMMMMVVIFVSTFGIVAIFIVGFVMCVIMMVMMIVIVMIVFMIMFGRCFGRSDRLLIDIDIQKQRQGNDAQMRSQNPRFSFSFVNVSFEILKFLFSDKIRFIQNNNIAINNLSISCITIKMLSSKCFRINYSQNRVESS